MAFRVTQHNSIRAVAIILSLLLLVVTISPALANPLTISSVAAGSITNTSATITWDTDEEGNSTVNYGNSTSLGYSSSNSALVLHHVINLTGLEAATTYYYEVISTNAGGNTTVDNNGGVYYTFTTKYSPPVISGVSAANITHVFAVISWATDQPSDSKVNYGNTTALGSSVSNSALLADHKISLISLASDTLYYYEAISINADGMSTVDNNAGNYYTFTTPQSSNLTGAVTSVIVGALWLTDKVLDAVVHLDDPEPLKPLGSANVRVGAEIAVRLVDTLAWFVELVVDSVRG